MYRGKRTAVTMPHSIYQIVHKLGVDESRTDSQQILALVKEALKGRGIEIPVED